MINNHRNSCRDHVVIPRPDCGAKQRHEVKIPLTPFKQILFILPESEGGRASKRLRLCTRNLPGPALYRSSSPSVLSFHLISSSLAFFTTDYRSPVDKNRKETRREIIHCGKILSGQFFLGGHFCLFWPAVFVGLIADSHHWRENPRGDS